VGAERRGRKMKRKMPSQKGNKTKIDASYVKMIVREYIT
jgi:hypothetical protein